MLEAAEKYLLYEIWPNGRLNSSLWGVLRSSWRLLMWIYLQVHLVIISAVFRATISGFVLSSYCVHVDISVLTTRKIMSVSFYQHISPLHCVLDVKRIQWCNPASSSVSSEQVRKQEFSVSLSVVCCAELTLGLWVIPSDGGGGQSGGQNVYHTCLLYLLKLLKAKLCFPPKLKKKEDKKDELVCWSC